MSLKGCKQILTFLAISSLVFGGMYLVANATTVFNSNQVGVNPVNGYYLQTNGATSTWEPVSGGSGSVTINKISTSTYTFTCTTSGTVASSTDGTGQGIISIGCGGASSTVVASGFGTTVTASGTTYTVNVNSSTILTVASGTALYYPLSSNPAGYVTSSVVSGYSTSTIVIGTSTASNTYNVTSSGNKTFTITIPSNVGFFTNDAAYATTTIQSVLNALSVSGCLTYSTSTGLFGTTCSTLATSTLNALYLQIANNLSDLTNTSTARSNLGLGSIATHPSTDYLPSSTVYVSTYNGSSGAVTGVSSFTGQNCVTAANSTGTVTLSVTCLSGNQVITIVATGTVTGSASGTTSITIPLSLVNSGVASGTYTCANLNVASSGVVTSATNGTCSGGGSGGSGNVFVTPTSSVVSGQFLAFISNNSSTVYATTTLTMVNATTTNASGTFQQNGINVLTATSTIDNGASFVLGDGTGFSQTQIAATLVDPQWTNLGTQNGDTGGAWRIVPGGDCVVLEFGTNGYQRSTNCGRTWSGPTSLGVQLLAGAYMGNNIWITSGSTSTVFISWNNGVSFTSFPNALTNASGTYGIGPLNPTTALIGTYNAGHMIQATIGATSTATFTDLGQVCQFEDAAPTLLQDGSVLTGCGFGNTTPAIIMRTPGGAGGYASSTWTQVASFSSDFDVDSFGVFPNCIVDAGSYPRGEIYQSRDCGQTWPVSLGSPFGTTPTSTIQSWISYGNGEGMMGTGIANGVNGTSTIWAVTNFGSTFSNVSLKTNTSTNSFLVNVGYGVTMSWNFNGQVLRFVPFGDPATTAATQMSSNTLTAGCVYQWTSGDFANCVATSTLGLGGGSGSGNLFVTPTSSIIANSVPYYTANATTTVSASSSLLVNGTNATTTGPLNVGNCTSNCILITSSTNQEVYLILATSSAGGVYGTAPIYIGASSSSTGNSAGASTTIEAATIASNTFQNTNDSIFITYYGKFAATSATNKQVQIAVGSTTIFDTGSAFIAASTACNWSAQLTGIMVTTTSTQWGVQWTDSCANALTDDSGDAGNALVNSTTTNPININVYGNGTNASDVIANMATYMFAKRP